MKKSLQDWEREKGMMIRGDNVDPTKQITEEEFDEIDASLKLGVAFEDRVEFLKKCGYARSRENMMNVQLPYREHKR